MTTLDHAAVAALPLNGADTVAFLRTAIRQAHSRVWILQFLIDARPSEDRYGEVRYVLHALGEAVARGVDVRLLMPIVVSARGG